MARMRFSSELIRLKSIDPNTGRQKILKDISTKDLSDELRTRAGVKTLVLTPEDRTNTVTFRSGRYHSSDSFSGPAVVLINQD